VAVCVAYHPDPSHFERVLRAACSQTQALIVVDNSQPACAGIENLCAAAGARHMPQMHNTGLATALNAGIEAALQSGATHVLLLDHDSIPAPGMVAALLRGLSEMGPEEEIGAVGPCYRDTISGRIVTTHRFEGWRRYKSNVHSSAGGYARTDMMITSGALIPRASLGRVGLMDQALFIDHIDTDWVFRARTLGLSLYLVVDARMDHRLGERCVTPPGFRGRAIVLHDAFRLYFIVRNSILLYRRPHAFARWIIFDLKRLLMLTAAHFIYGPARATIVREVVRGALHGLKGKTGPRE
jgi:rhamnosyltransferase